MSDLALTVFGAGIGVSFFFREFFVLNPKHPRPHTRNSTSQTYKGAKPGVAQLNYTFKRRLYIMNLTNPRFGKLTNRHSASHSGHPGAAAKIC